HAARRRGHPRRAVPRLLRGGARHFPARRPSGHRAEGGLSVDAARDVLEKRTFKDVVDADWKLSREYGITGVPTFVAGEYGVIGAHPYEELVQLVQKAAPQEDSEGYAPRRMEAKQDRPDGRTSRVDTKTLFRQRK